MDEERQGPLSPVPLPEPRRLDDPSHHLLLVGAFEPKLFSLAQFLALQALLSPEGDLLDIAQSGQGGTGRFNTGRFRSNRVRLADIEHVILDRVCQRADGQQERRVAQGLDGSGRSVEKERGRESIGLFEVVRQGRASILGDDVQRSAVRGPLQRGETV